MAITTFIPELWSARLLANLEQTHVATNFVNRYYEGEIRRAGDTVHIGSLGAITISDYSSNTDMTAPQVLSTTDQAMVIDQAKSFNFTLDDIDKAQAAGDLMEMAMAQAAYSLGQVADTFIFDTMKAAVTPMTTVALTVENVYTSILAMKTALDEKNVPLEGRTLAISPAVHALLLQDERFVGNGGTDAQTRLKKGFVGEIAGFAVFLTNNLPATTAESKTTTYLIAGHPMGCSYAEQIVSLEAYRLEKRFADGMKGLHVYGAKVVEKNAIAVLPVTIA